VFSGAGLSASTGMSTFSTPGGLYDRAKKRLKMPASGDGSRLFHAKFFAGREADVHAFLAELAAEAARAAPSPGHAALARMAGAGAAAAAADGGGGGGGGGGVVVRHYTLNVDGLAGAAGMPLWDWDARGGDGERPAGAGGGDDGGGAGGGGNGPDGTTVELHGNVRRMVCRSCGARADLTPRALRDMRDGRPLQCLRGGGGGRGGAGGGGGSKTGDDATAADKSGSGGGGGGGGTGGTGPPSSRPPCPPGSGRTGILLYDDPDAALITPAAPAWRLLAGDLARAAAVLWLGISFEQSASVAYFSRVVRGLREARDAREEGRRRAGEEGDGANGAQAEQTAVEDKPSGRAPATRAPPPLPPPPPALLPLQVIVNPSEDAMFNLLSGAGAGDLGKDVRLVELRMGTDAALPAMAARLLSRPSVRARSKTQSL